MHSCEDEFTCGDMHICLIQLFDLINTIVTGQLKKQQTQNTS